MNLLSVAGFAIVACIIAVVLKEYKPEYQMMISILTGVIIFGYALVQALPVFTSMMDMFSQTSLPSDYAMILMKALGLCLVTQLTSDVCNDSGHSAIASKVELVGKIAILLQALPLFEQLLQIIYQLIFRS